MMGRREDITVHTAGRGGTQTTSPVCCRDSWVLCQGVCGD